MSRPAGSAAPPGAAPAAALLAVLFAAPLAGCLSSAPPRDAWMPRIAPADAPGAKALGVDAAEIGRLQLIAADLVSALVQLPGTSPSGLTLQVSAPGTAFGHVLVRALEDAGYGLQRVSADQGLHYVSYRRRTSLTDAGETVDYGLAIGELALSREYVVEEGRIYPSSPMTIAGSDPGAVALDDALFREQGGRTAFVSGVRGPDGLVPGGGLVEVRVSESDALPADARTAPAAHVEAALLEGAGRGAPLPDERTHERLRRTVLIFDDASTRVMGAANKRAVRLLVRDFDAADVFVVNACTDADGRNEAAASRALRVREEFLGHGLPEAAVRTGPCIRASYRHPSDDAPVPVEIVQYRSRR